MNSTRKKGLICVITAAAITVAVLLVCALLTLSGKNSAFNINPAEVIESPEKEILLINTKYKKHGALTLLPIFDADAKSPVYGYVLSAEKDIDELGSIISVNADGSPEYDGDALVTVEAYSDRDGNLLALRDTKDLNENGNSNELLRLNYAKDSSGVRKYFTEYTVLRVKRKSAATLIKLESGNIQTLAVNANNRKTAKKLANMCAKNGAAAKVTAAKSDGNKDENNADDLKLSGEEIPITLLPDRRAKADSKSVKISNGKVTITKSGRYHIKSETDVWHGEISVVLKNTEKAEIKFSDVNIQNDSQSIISIIDASIDADRSFLESEAEDGTSAEDMLGELEDFEHAPNVHLSFPKGTHSRFATVSNSKSGVLYNEAKLIIKGRGSAEFSSVRNPNNCICSSKSIKIRNVSLSLNTPQNENTSAIDKKYGSARGIFSKSRVTLESGTLNIKTNGDSIRCDRFEGRDGECTLMSSACDGIDADDSIVINGGKYSVTALQKYSFKVRRINNTEKGYIQNRIRDGRGDTFLINGGTVRGESKKLTTVQPDSAQAVISCKMVKPSHGTSKAQTEVKTPEIISIDGVAVSKNRCTKFLYSSNKINRKTEYTAAAGKEKTALTPEEWEGNTALIKLISSQSR